MSSKLNEVLMKQDASILIVDDDVVIIKIILNILNKNGYSTDVCKSGERALERIKSRNYDLVMLDVHLGSGMDGYKTCEEIQKINHDLPVILMTADNDDESVNKGFQAGSSDYIKKPLSKMELLARVNKTINFNRSEKRNLQLIYDLSKDLETAAKIQTSMLPKWVYLDSEIIFSSHYEPFEAVGGDLFDRIKINDDCYVVYLGDISGHGVQAALLMTAIKSIIKIMVETDKDNTDLPWLVTKLNNRLSNELFIFDNYLTLLIGIIDLKKNEFRYLNAGHPPIVMIDTITGEPSAIESAGSLPLGWMPNIEYREEDMGMIPISDHQIVLLFSDGIYECVNPKGEQFGMQGVLHSLRNYINPDSCISLPFKIKQYLTDNNYNISADDFTLFAFQKRRHPHHSEPVTIWKESQAVHYTFSLQSALREVGKTSQQCEALILNWKGNNSLAARVELIVDEFLNNIIKYGYRYSEDASIVVEFNMNENQLVIKFWDKGIEWNLVDNLYTEANPYNFDDELYEVDGKGVKIIMSMSSKFQRYRYGQLNETIVQLDL
jgi:sigma-B regulation protein RsbU (phosphoserine phosphatase)